MKVFLTGGTGFIGKKVVSNLASKVDKIYLLTRPKSLNKAKKSFSNFSNIEFVVGDITDNDVLHDIEQFFDVINNADVILNIAGYYDLEITEIDSYTHNVIGVQNVMHLARKFKNLKYFHHISTYAVTGGLKGQINENDMDDPRKFRDHYARSKMQGESIFRKTDLPGVRKRVYRPGIVVGSLKDGEIEKVDGPYYLMRFIYKNQKLFKLLSALKYFPMPYNKDATLPLIPVDVLSDWLCRSVLSPDHSAEIRSYNLIGEDKIYIGDFIQYLFNEYKIKASPLRLKRLESYKYLLPMLGMPKELLEYMYNGGDFDLSNRKTDFPDFEEFKLNDITFNLIKGSERFFKEYR